MEQVSHVVLHFLLSDVVGGVALVLLYCLRVGVCSHLLVWVVERELLHGHQVRVAHAVACAQQPDAVVVQVCVQDGETALELSVCIRHENSQGGVLVFYSQLNRVMLWPISEHRQAVVLPSGLHEVDLLLSIIDKSLHIIIHLAILAFNKECIKEDSQSIELF
jgi:hypothetical protein